jgi:pimeloyl-ACP methyl ester carboxylesterase
VKRESFKLSDGRNLEYLCNGAINKSAIILHAGTTQDITGWQTWLDYFASQNVFALAIGRSGYASSSKKVGRITLDIALDVAELSSALGITKFVNIGLSGGGQHAIATGLDPRSAGVVTIGSLAPYVELGKDFYNGMQQADLDEYSDAIKDINLLIKRFQSWQNQDLTQTIGGAQLSENDQKASDQPTWKCIMQSCEFTMSQGWDWVADDYSSYLNPWGFDPRDVKVPTVIWQGGLDKNVPKQHGIWLAKHMPNARLELKEDESHLGIYVNYEVDIMKSGIALLIK